MKKVNLVISFFTCFTMLLVASFALKNSDPLTESIKRGKVVYEANCISCHMAAGEGIEGVFPPLAKSDYLMADTKRAVKQIIFGIKGEMKVNGVSYNGEMPANALNDKQVADVMNYIRNNWGNKGKIVTEAEVKLYRTAK